MPLGERLRGGDAAGAPPTRSTLAQHVWLLDAPGQPGRWPGLLVEWRRQDAGGWEARVVYAAPDADRPSVPRVLERWLPGECLRPVTAL